MRKGAFDQATADQRFQAWKEGRVKELAAVADKTAADKKAAAAARLENEKKVNAAIAEKVADKKAAEAAAKAEAEAAAAAEEAAVAGEEPAAETPAE